MRQFSSKKEIIGFVLLASIATLATLGMLFARFHYINLAEKSPEITTPSIALQHDKIPAHAIISVQGIFDPAILNYAYTDSPSDKDALFALKGEKNLVLYCPYLEPCFKKIPELTGEQEFVGRLYDFNQYVGTEVPALAIRQFVTENLHADESKVRVLHLGETPGNMRHIALMVSIVAALFAMCALILWVLAIRGILYSKK